MIRKPAILVALGIFASSVVLAGPMSTLDCKPSAAAGGDPAHEEEGDSSNQEKGKTLSKLIDPRDLEPTQTERMLSSLSLKFEILDQADFTAFSETRPSFSNPDITVPVVVFRPARDEELFKGSLTMSFAALFETVDSLHGLYSAIASNRQAFDLSERSSVDREDAFNYFARRRPKDLRHRFLSGITLSIGLSERAEAANGPQLPGDEEEETFSLTFDPVKLFASDKEIKTAIASTYNYAKAYQDHGVLRHLPECTTVRKCFEILEEESPSKFWRAVLPKFEAKSVDQFDFFTLQDRFRTTPLLEDSIESYTFTWSLSNAFNTGPEKLARLEAAKQLAKIGKGLEKDIAIVPLAVSSRTGEQEPLLLPITVKNTVGDAKLKFSRNGDCPGATEKQVFPGLSFSGTQLVGYPETAGKCRFALTAQDEVGRVSDVMDCTIEIGR